MLRHTFCTRCAEAGLDIKVLQMIMGHSDISITMNIYNHVDAARVQNEIKRKIEDAKNSKKLLEQNELFDKIKLKDFLGIQKFDTEKLREVIKVIRVHSQDEIEIEWNFDDIFSEQR